MGISPVTPERTLERQTLRAERDALRAENAKLRESLDRAVAQVQQRQQMLQAMGNDAAKLAMSVAQEAPKGPIRDFADLMLRRMGLEPPKRNEATGLVVVQGGMVRK